jgi:hypothetical protein
LTKGARDRTEEEAVVDIVLLNALAEAAGLSLRLPLSLRPEEQIATENSVAADTMGRFLRGEFEAVCALPDGRVDARQTTPRLLVSGAFNPVHEGHWGLAMAAARITGETPAFELSVLNMDKPALTAADIRQRAQQFTWRGVLWLTRAPSFAEKARLFPGARFVVGADTAERVVDLRYYAGDERQRREAHEEIRKHDCRFVVAGRVNDSGRFVSLHDLAIPDDCRDLYSEIPEAEYRSDASSTELRKRDSAVTNPAAPAAR